MKRVFVSVGTSLFERDLLGPRDAFRPLRDRCVLAAWDDAAERRDTVELSTTEAEARFSAALEAARTLDETAAGSDLSAILDDFPTRIALLRDAFVVDGDEIEAKMLSAELASLWRLLTLDRLEEGDHLVLLATDSPEGRLAGSVLGGVLQGHPALEGAAVEVVWPRHWQAHDGVRLAAQGASNLLIGVSRRIAVDLRACPFFVLTGGIKLGIAILSQVSCWSQTHAHDGLFLKLEDPGGIFFPPSSFVERARDRILLPHRPKAEHLRSEVPFIDRLREVTEVMNPPGGGDGAPRTTLVVTVGVGLVRTRPELLEARYGASSLLADRATWNAIDEHALCRSWQELRSQMSGAPSDEDLENAVGDIIAQLQSAWNDGRTNDLPAELAALRGLWDTTRPIPVPRLRGNLRLVLLATDSLTGEYCASLVGQFLEQVEGYGQVDLRCVSGFHPFGGLSSDGVYFTRMAEIVAEVATHCDRLMMVPLGGTKLHLPLLTALATRLHAPAILGHVGLEHPIVVPWLESDGARVRAARLGEAWPELSGLPTVRLELERD